MRTMCRHGETGRCGYCLQEQNLAEYNEWRASKGLAPITAAGEAAEVVLEKLEPLTEWKKDGDPCNDCGSPARYVEATGWYEHIDWKAPKCFLMGSAEEPFDKEPWWERGTV